MSHTAYGSMNAVRQYLRSKVYIGRTHITLFHKVLLVHT